MSYHKFSITSFFLITMFFNHHVSAILDGRITPIVLSNSYTFTNFEWARGFVVFNKGFSIPSTTTITLDVYSPINGTINFNTRGTIIMRGPLKLGKVTITTPAYIKTNNYEISYALGNRIILTRPIFFVQDDAIINFNNLGGMQGSSFTSSLNAYQIKNLTLKNGTLFFANPAIRIIFPPDGLDSFTFHNIAFTIFGNGILSVNAKNFIISGTSTISGRGATIIAPQQLTLLPNANLILEEFMIAQVNQLNTGSNSSRIKLGNDTNFVFTSTTSTTITGSGSFLISGSSKFTGQNTTVTLNPSSRIMISSGSRLALDLMTLKIT